MKRLKAIDLQSLNMILCLFVFKSDLIQYFG